MLIGILAFLAGVAVTLIALWMLIAREIRNCF